MNRDELRERLKGYEWNDIEFKEALREVPNAAYETVSAFANTAGGWLIFGIRQKDGSYEIIGVIEVDRVQNAFLSTLRSCQKLNRPIVAKEYLLREDDKALLIFYIPEARRQEKPVYLNGDIKRSFIRRGGCDERCSQSEIERFLREASTERYDGEPIDLDPERCFDSDSVQWYREAFHRLHPGQDTSISDIDFLYHWGFVIEQSGKFMPTRASVLLFGMTAALHQILPRPVVDYQWINAEWSEGLPEQRWADRLVIETNLIQAWKDLLGRYLQHAEKPFAIQLDTLQREDIPPDYIAFRETAVNLLIHQDYGDHGRKPVIQFFRDRTVFWNPGDAFATPEELLESGEKEVRNPRIVAAFRRIGLSEQAGTGMRSIFRSWGQLGHVPPVIKNDKARKSFQLSLLKDELVSEEQLLFQASLGVHLREHEAASFAFACRQGRLHLIDVKAVTGLAAPAAQSVLNQLVAQVLIERVEAAPQPYYVVVEHLRSRLTEELASTGQSDVTGSGLVSDQPTLERHNLVTDQPRPLLQLNNVQREIVMFCDIPRPMNTIMEHLGMKHRAFFRRTNLEPLLNGGVLCMTHPQRPNHPKQAYVLTEVGVKLKGRYLDQGGRSEPFDFNDEDPK